jgi:hypothetical protein
MAKITDWLNVRKGGVAQLNISVKTDLQQPLADALEWLKVNNIRASKSELAATAIIEYAKEQKSRQG